MFEFVSNLLKKPEFEELPPPPQRFIIKFDLEAERGGWANGTRDKRIEVWDYGRHDVRRYTEIEVEHLVNDGYIGWDLTLGLDRPVSSYAVGEITAIHSGQLDYSATGGFYARDFKRRH